MKQNFRVTYCVLNLRMGGQVSNILGLISMLRERGIGASLALPASVASASKVDLTRFASLPATTRIVSMLRMLRALPEEPGQLVHFVLPTPSFAPICLLTSTPLSQIVVQSEGLPIALDREHQQLLREDPVFFAPRVVLNHKRLVAAARIVPVAHLVTARSYQDTLRRLGFADVTYVENVARFEKQDTGELPASIERAFGPGRTVLGYIGHCHPVKGVDDLVQAFASAQRDDLELVLALSEDGNAERIRGKVAQLPSAIQARVHFAGLVPVQTLLARLDALVLPYRSIASTTIYPSLLLEADEALCPLIVSEVSPLDDILPVDQSGCVRVPPRDVPALTRALEQISPRSLQLGARARLNLPSAEQRLDQLIELYARIASVGLRST